MIHLPDLSHVCLNGSRLNPLGLNFGGYLLDRCKTAATKHHINATPGAFAGDAGANTAASSGDNGDLTLQ
jgi:hypothetical protein